MKRKRFVLMLAATLVAAMLAGCTKPKREVESWPSNPYALTGVPIITQAGQEAGAAGDAAGEKVPETTRGTEETRPTKPLSTVPTETEKGVINHGHSIKDAGDYDNRLIRRTSDVILTEAQALKYLEDSITLQPEGLSFRLTDTSDKDPGAFMWYEFTVFRGNLKVMNSEFRVICFTDGTICEGKSWFTTCAFYDREILDSKTALEKYRETLTYEDKRNYGFAEKCYFFSGRQDERCPVVYIYRYKGGRLLLDASNGKMIGLYKDMID